MLQCRQLWTNVGRGYSGLLLDQFRVTLGSDVSKRRDIRKLSCDISSATRRFKFAFENPFVLV